MHMKQNMRQQVHLFTALKFQKALQHFSQLRMKFMALVYREEF